MTFRPHTHYAHRMRGAADPAAELRLASGQARRCAAGEHDVVTVGTDKVVYGPFGRRRPVGERYCRYCQGTFTALAPGSADGSSDDGSSDDTANSAANSAG